MNIFQISWHRQVKRWTWLFLAVALSAFAAAQGQPPARNDQPLSARIQRLDDIEEIRTLLVQYARCLDENDLVGFPELFAKDAEFVAGSRTVKGAAELALMQKSLTLTGNGTYHLMSNFEIDVHGDTATAWSRFTFIIPNADKKPSLSSGGHYEDNLVRENGHWKFKRRVVINNIPH